MEMCPNCGLGAHDKEFCLECGVKVAEAPVEEETHLAPDRELRTKPIYKAPDELAACSLQPKDRLPLHPRQRERLRLD